MESPTQTRDSCSAAPALGASAAAVVPAEAVVPAAAVPAEAVAEARGVPAEAAAPARDLESESGGAPCAPCPHLPPPGPPAEAASLCVVSDNYGFVGAYHSLTAAREFVLKKYASIPFLVQRFPRAPGGCDKVWVVLYRDIDAVAFVSNDQAEASRVKELLLKVGLAYPDTIECWEQPLGQVLPQTAERLASRHRAHQMYAGSVVAESLESLRAAEYARVSALLAPEPDGPLEKAIRENERITIMDCVVPVDGSPDDP